MAGTVVEIEMQLNLPGVPDSMTGGVTLISAFGCPVILIYTYDTEEFTVHM